MYVSLPSQLINPHLIGSTNYERKKYTLEIGNTSFESWLPLALLHVNIFLTFTWNLLQVLFQVK